MVPRIWPSRRRPKLRESYHQFESGVFVRAPPAPCPLRSNFSLQNLSISWTMQLTAGAPDSVPQVLGPAPIALDRKVDSVLRTARKDRHGHPARSATVVSSGQKESVSEEALCW